MAVEKKTIYVDMDGVLAKWNPSASAEEVAARGYFLEREVDKNITLAVLLLRYEYGYDVRVLSAAYTVRACWEKRQWLDNHGLSDIEAVFVPYGEPKSDYVDAENSVLIDDFGKNLAEWTGIAIKYYNGINGHGGTHYKYAVNFYTQPGKIAEYISRVITQGEKNR